jgi:hypothetical protein
MEITNKNNIENLQKVLDTLMEWAVENGVKINPGKCKAVQFTRDCVKNPPGHSLGDQKFSDASSCKYFLRIDLIWVDQVNYIVLKAWKTIHFVMRVLKKGNMNTKI